MCERSGRKKYILNFFSFFTFILNLHLCIRYLSIRNARWRQDKTRVKKIFSFYGYSILVDELRLYTYTSTSDCVHIVRANAAGYILRNMSNMSDNVLHRYIGIRERIGNRSAYGQRDGPKTNVPIISRNCGWQWLALWLTRRCIPPGN